MRAAHRVGVLLAGLALLDRPGELLLDLADALGQRRVVDLAQHDLIARLGRDLGDAVAHQPRSQHSHLLDLAPSDLRLVFVEAVRSPHTLVSLARPSA